MKETILIKYDEEVEMYVSSILEKPEFNAIGSTYSEALNKLLDIYDNFCREND